MADVKVGIVLLEYADRMSVIGRILADASIAAREVADLFVGDEGFYDGDARAELKKFYENLAANVDKLVLFDFVGSQFLRKVFAEFEFTDRELSSIVDGFVGGG